MLTCFSSTLRQWNTQDSKGNISVKSKSLKQSQNLNWQCLYPRFHLCLSVCENIISSTICKVGVHFLSHRGTTGGTRKQPRQAGAGPFASLACPLQHDDGHWNHTYSSNTKIGNHVVTKIINIFNQ